MTLLLSIYSKSFQKTDEKNDCDTQQEGIYSPSKGPDQWAEDYWIKLYVCKNIEQYHLIVD